MNKTMPPKQPESLDFAGQLLQMSDAELARVDLDVRRELRRRLRSRCDTFGTIRGLEAVKRAAMIAAAGKHSILIVGAPGIGKTLIRAGLAEIGHEASYEAWPCPCGYINNPRRDCRCGEEEHQQHRRNFPVAEIYIEAVPPSARELSSSLRGTTLDEIREQIARMSPPFPKKAEKEVQTILMQAVRELGLSPAEVEERLNVAVTIARLDGVQELRSHHVFEAINYRRFS